MTGCNVDPLYENNRPNLQQLLAAGFGWVRFVSRPGVEGYSDLVRQAGIMALAVITEESKGTVCPADAYQIGNEPDDHNAGANKMSPSELVQYWNLYYGTYFAPGSPLAGKIVIGPGLCSGQPIYWAQVQQAGGLKGATGFAVHPYNKTAAEARSLLTSYQRITPNLPLWVTEWNRPPAEIPAFQNMLRGMASRDAWFCWNYQDAAGNVWTLSPDAGRDINA